MWKYGFSSIIGTSHTRASLPGQDACVVEVLSDLNGDEILIAAVSDGAGSARFGHVGSQLACDLFIADSKSVAGIVSDSRIEDWIAKFQTIILEKCRETDLTAQDFACTLLAAVIGKDSAAFFQIGDGAIVIASDEKPDLYRCVCWPQQGEYANTTNFLTDFDAAQKMFRGTVRSRIDEVALFTDGLQNLVLDYRSHEAHSPFFTPLFAWLRPRSAGYSQELSDSLASYLNSEKINLRTDDDKTLILAGRRKP